MNVYITDRNKQAEVLDFIAAKTNLYKSLFKVFVVDEIIRNNSGKVRYKDLDAVYAK